ncbi:MAG TPA: hypothetical protein ENK70_04270 [Methylophaga sp.]|nr:hypothetical protein [Methylophaga sp.]
MAKKKENKPTRIGNILSVAAGAHKKDVGAGGQVWDPYLSHVRSIRFPSLGLMAMLGFTGLRDSCTILIDGAPGSHKSSLAIEMFNWGVPYGLGGAIIDCENKAAVDIAMGTLDETTLWLPGHLTMLSTFSVEDTQDIISDYVKKCAEMNKGIERNQQVPFMVIVDPIAGTPADETLKQVKKYGHGDKGHGGRAEANIWNSYIKVHESQIINLPFISVFVNHMKMRQKQNTGPITVMEKYNPGGISQNYATTIALRCSSGRAVYSESLTGKSYNEVWIKCEKNSRGPTGVKTCVRKYWRRRKDGLTSFWWDWGRNTAEYLASLPANSPAREICSVVKSTNEKFSCKKLGFKDASPTEIGDTVMADRAMVSQIVNVLMLRKLDEFDPISDDDRASLRKIAHENHLKYLAEAGIAIDAEENASDNEDEPTVEEDPLVIAEPTINLDGDGTDDFGESADNNF